MIPASAESRHHWCCPRCLAPFRKPLKRCPADGAVLEARAVDPLIGTIIAQRYRIEALIGEGGIGRVYRAQHTRISRRYAIKVPFGELAFDEVIRRRLANEAEAASRVEHPNLVGVVDVGETAAGLFYLAMDLVQGQSLATILDGGAVEPTRALRLAAQIADGLGHAHERGLIHRDLKPDNIIVELDHDGRERARIVDFGIALVVDDALRRMTAEGMVIGTPEYMAPEQLTGAAVDARADLFALGLVLYELLAGVLPFAGSALEIATKNLTVALPPIASRAPGRVVDARVEALVQSLCDKAPTKRPASGALVAARLRELAELTNAAAEPEVRGPLRVVVTTEAWSPIVVPTVVRGSAHGPAAVAATVQVPITPRSGLRLATVVAAVAPPPTRPPPSSRAVGTAPPSAARDTDASPTVVPLARVPRWRPGALVVTGLLAALAIATAVAVAY